MIGQSETLELAGQETLAHEHGQALGPGQPNGDNRVLQSPASHQLHGPDGDTSSTREIQCAVMALDDNAVDTEASKGDSRRKAYGTGPDHDHLGLNVARHTENLTQAQRSR